MPFRMGPTELIIILVIVTMIFGVGRLPQVGNSIGKALKEFRRGQEEVEETLKEVEVVSTSATSNGKKNEEERL